MGQLDKRMFRLKNPAMAFFCPLCRSEREIRTHSRLSMINYVQILFISIVSLMTTIPFFGAKALFIPFCIFAFFESGKKLLFRNQVPCPHCGFDATWYKRDVKKARQQVEEFWRHHEATKKLKT